MMDLFKSKRRGSVLGLALDGNRLEAVVLRRSNGTLRVRQSVSADLALSPLTDDPELVGREIRNHLDKAGLRERRCAVCLPLGWLLTLQTELPELPEAERDSFLQLEAERSFHGGPEALLIAHSLFQPKGGKAFATLLAMPRAQLGTLERVLRAAKLKPVTFALGIGALQPAAADQERVIALAVRANTIDLQISGGGGIVALRSLDGAIETQGGQKRISAELTARELRITLGQLPPGMADAPGKIRIFGQGEMCRQFVQDISPRLQAMGLAVETVERAPGATFEPLPPANLAVSPALALAAAWVRGADSKPEFLPPRVQPWQRIVSTRLSARTLTYAGGAAAAVVLAILIAFGVQQWQINSLQKQWDDMTPLVSLLTTDQDLIKEFRPWYDRTFRDLRILRRLTEAFPEDGSVSAKSVDIRDVSGVSCSGIARDKASFLKMNDKLGQYTNEISNLHAETKVQKPTQFILSFQWEQGEVANGN
ncbi:MAG: hypothetical protein ACLQVY_11650 [Limisphaerales bacterium]